MDLRIAKIVDHGKPTTERVVLQATADTNIHFYALCDNTYVSGTTKLSNKRRNFFWFPHKEVKRGEIVRLFTGIGADRSHIPKGSTVMHHDFYWGLTSGVWNNNGDLAILFEIEQIEQHVVNKPPTP